MNTLLLIILAVFIVRFVVIPLGKWYGRRELSKPVVYRNVTEMFSDEPATSPKWKHIRRGTTLTGQRDRTRVKFIFLDGTPPTSDQISEWSDRIAHR